MERFERRFRLSGAFGELDDATGDGRARVRMGTGELQIAGRVGREALGPRHSSQACRDTLIEERGRCGSKKNVVQRLALCEPRMFFDEVEQRIDDQDSEQ